MIRPSDALVILTKIRCYHGPQDVSDATCQAWAEALTGARTASVANCVQAVIRHYSTPGSNPWITPGDVIAGARVVADDRLDRTEMPVPNANPDDPKAYAAEYRALRDGIRNGDLSGDRLEAYRRGEISLTGRRALTGPMSDPDPDVGARIVREALERKRAADEARAAAEAAAAAELEAERARQLAEIQARIDAEGALS